MHYKRYRTAPLLLFLLTAFSVAGCTTTTTQSFNVVENARVESGYIAPNADFSRFSRLTADDMGIFFPPDSAPSTASQAKLRGIFRQSFLAQLTDYDIVEDASDPSTLLVRASLIDFRNASAADVMSVGMEVRDLAKPGALIFLMDLVDPVSGEVLGRAADSADIPTISADADNATNWQAVETAADRWALIFREFLDRNLKQ